MKKLKSLNDVQNFFEQLGAKKEKSQGFVSWTLDSKDFNRPQASKQSKKVNE